MRLAQSVVALLIILVPVQVFAFCGFYVGGGDASLYNDATQVVLMRHENTTVLSMQNKYEGPIADFAMVVPVPQVLKKENVNTLNKAVFDRVDRLGAPRLVEYWERNPCYSDILVVGGTTGEAGGGYGGLGMAGLGRGGGGYAEVQAEFEVGEYEIAILDTNDATALDAWLKENNYKTPAGATPYFEPYIQGGMYFFVAKVNAKKVAYKDGKAVLSPLRFHYQSEEFSLPIRLGMINSKGQQDLLVHILAVNERYEAANYKNVTIPTNIEVGPNIKGKFGEFYDALFSRTVQTHPKTVVTEYAWPAQQCDPCPSGRFGGGLQKRDLVTLGSDVLKPLGSSQWWVLTRLHARYPKDGIGEDLVFKKAHPINGGLQRRKVDGTLEKGAVESSGNNFQGRYVIRNEWEGKVECDTPERGFWTGPPDVKAMNILADGIVTEMRRSRAATRNREPTQAELEAEWNAEESAAVAYQMRPKFGTTVIPEAVGTLTAASPNTRKAELRGSGVDLSAIVREPIPELNVKPASKAPARTQVPKAHTPAEQTEQVPPVPAAQPSGTGCNVAMTHPEPWGFVVLLGLMVRRRR